MLKPIRCLSLVAAFFLLVGVVAPNHGALAQVVTNTMDAGAGSLRAAITTANAGGGTITFDIDNGVDPNCAGGVCTITLTTVGFAGIGNSALDITDTITIEGDSDPDGDAIVIDADGDKRHFLVTSAGDLTLEFLTLQNGMAEGFDGGESRRGGTGGGGAGLGGSILNDSGTLTVLNSTLTGNTVQGGNGGAIEPENGNPRGGSGGAGLSGNGGDATPIDTPGAGGSGGGGDGGDGDTCGVGDPGTSLGGAGGGGGGTANNPACTGGAGDVGGGGGGGGGGSTGQPAGSGGSSGLGGGNGASGTSGGGIGQPGGGGGGGGGLGGAIFNNDGTITVRNSTISGNTATGGSGGGGNGGNTGSAGQGLGGGIFNYNGTLTTQNVTINDNTADDAGGIYNLGDGATATATVDNTILANSDDTENAPKNGSVAPVDDFVGGTVSGGTNTNSGTGNLIERETGFSGTIDTSSDPQLDALADNGGLTETHNLQDTSPAIDEGDGAKVPGGQTTDQRGGGFPRETGTVDIGAIESGSQPDLEVTKTDSPDPVTAGSGASNLTHTVTVENVGSGDATGVALSEAITLPAGVTIVSITPSAGSYAPANDPNGTWTVGSLGTGVSETLTIVYTVGPSATDGAMVSNTAMVSAITETDPDNTNDSFTEETTIQRRVDLEVTKTDDVDPVIAGSGASNLTHTVTVENIGPSDASGVELSEVITLPAGVSIDSVTPSVGSFVGTTWTLGDLAAGASETLTVVYTVGPSAPDASTVSNTAAVTMVNETDTVPGNDSFTEDTTVDTKADLSITKTDDVDPIEPGNTLIYTVTVDNAGPSDAQNVIVAETLPAGVTFVATIGCTEDPGGDPTCTLGTIPAGGSAAYTVEVTIDSPVAAGVETITNAVSVTSDTTDPDGSDNDTDEETTIDAEPDLALTKDDGGGFSRPDEIITYTLDYVNNGDQDAGDVTIEDTVPDNTTFDTANSTSGWSCSNGDPAGTLCTFDVDAEIGTVTGLGGTGSVVFAVKVNNPMPANVNQVDNEAEIIDGTGEDPNTADNTDTDVTPILARPVVVVAKMEASIIDNVGGPGADPGDRIEYKVTIENVGDQDADAVVFNDTPDAHTTLVNGSVTTTQGSITSGNGGGDTSVGVTIGTLAGAGGTVMVIFVVEVNDPFPADVFDVTNQGTVSGNNFDSVLTDDPSVAGKADPTVSRINRADVAITKGLTVFSADSGGPGVDDDTITATFTLTATNKGPDDATGVEVHDPVPAGVTFVSASGAYSAVTGIWTIGNLDDGDSVTLVLVLTAPATNNLVNIASVKATQPDPDLGNNLDGAQAQHDLDLRRFTADLSMTKTVDDATPGAGDLVVYTLEVFNNGPSTTAGVVARDRLPDGLAFVSATTTSAAGRCSTCGYNDSLGVWIVGHLPKGETASLEITARVTGTGEIINTAEIIESNLPDPDSILDDDNPRDDDQDSATINVSSAQAKSTATESEAGVPTDFTLHQNYPNPFNPETTIPYALPVQGHVRIAVYDLLGREVAVLLDDVVSAGRHEVRWQADNMPTGIYLVRLQSGATVKTQRTTLLK